MSAPVYTDTDRLDYLEAHPHAFFTVDAEEAPNVVALNERDGSDLTGAMGLGSGPTVRDAIDDSMRAQKIRPGGRITLDLQLSINRTLLDRVGALERQVKELGYRQAV